MTVPDAGTPTVVTKLAAAQRQLRTAVSILFEHGDDVSVHTLVAAARQILLDLLRREGKKSRLAESAETVVKPEGVAIFAKAIARAENFFKHADRDADARLEFDAQQTHFLIFDCADAYHALTGRQLRELQAFLLWFTVEYPDLLHPGPIKASVTALTGEAGALHRDRRLFFAEFNRAAKLWPNLD